MSIKPKRPSAKRWTEIREWLNVGVAVAALLIGIVSFWTTTRVSGIEDYLRSEIQRRNTELTSLADRSLRLEKVADERSQNLERLQAATDTLLATTAETQNRLTRSTAELGAVRDQVASSRLDLVTAKGDMDKAQARLTRSEKEFELFQRQVTAEYLALQTVFQSFYENETEASATPGLGIVNVLRTSRVPEGRESMTRAFQRVSENIERVCPNLREWKFKLGNKPVPPDQPTISYVRGTSADQIKQLTKEAQNRWSEAWDAYLKSSKEYTNAHIKATDDLNKYASGCICSALADSEFSAANICPAKTSR